ncbi:hypothetical protein F5Y16DRAFT_393084 [Xylariaceae sp. FL0255]|nr:hypothetical protein F5Y16DRAFT_393084 [Xylariaceae sp. FL0255]
MTSSDSMQPATGGDEPMPDAPPKTKPKRRFAPQLVEQTTKSSSSSSNRKQQQQQDDSSRSAASVASELSITPDHTRRSTRDASVQVNDTDMPDAPRQPPTKTKPARRFAPVPIETTFDSYRISNRNPHGPAAEPTPDPSPTTPQSSSAFSSTDVSMASEPKPPTATKPKRRFAPQLIETTKRERRTGQKGPACQPTDKTDITPGTDHIYAPKPKRATPAALRPTSTGSNSPRLSHATDERGESSSPYLHALRQRSHLTPRRSTRTNSYHPELDTILSSESGSSGDEGDDASHALSLGPPALASRRHRHGDSWSTRNSDSRNRRESCDEETSAYLLAVAAREAEQQHEFEQALSAFPNGMRPQGVEHWIARDNSEDEIRTDDEPPLRHGPSQLLRRKSTDPGWAVKEMRAHAEKLAETRGDTMDLDDSEEPEMAPPPADPLWTTTNRRHSRDSERGTSKSPYLSAHSPSLLARSSPAQEKHFASPPSGGGLRASPFGVPFAFRGAEQNDRESGKMRKTVSPPMLGKDLTFRMLPSPQHTRMEPDQPYYHSEHSERPEEVNRDTSGSTGLWRGYCSTKSAEKDMPALQAPPLLHTPGDRSPIDNPFDTPMTFGGALSPTGKASNLHRGMLSGLDERLKGEIDRKEREEALLAEFDDAFITQVYNYISLGYPAMARDFDDELSKISGICLEELRKDDHLKINKGFMLRMEMNVPSSGSTSSSGTDSSGDEMMSTTSSERRHRHKPPRWKALKLYIHEWARQHPSLNGNDDANHLAWGVRARRGSWAI